MLTFKLAFRSLWRHRVRTILTLSAIVFGHALFQIFVGLGFGSHDRMVEIGVRQGSAGHVVVQAEGYQTERTVELTVADGEDVRRAIVARLPRAEVVLRAFGGGLARTSHDAVGVLFSGVEPRRERRVSEIARAIRRGVYLDRDAPAGAKDLWCARPLRPGEPPVRRVLVGEGLARTLRVGLCDKLTLDAQGLGAQESVQLRVVGIFRTGNADLDGFFVVLPLPDVQRLLHLDGAVHQVAILVGDAKGTRAATAATRAAVADRSGLDVLPWSQVLPELAEFIWFDETSGWVMYFILYVIIAIGVLNTILMSVMERTREIGVMRALGTTGGRVVRMVLAEAFLLAVFGVAIGWVIAAPALYHLSTTGLDLLWFTESGLEAGGVNLSLLKARLYPSVVILGTLAVISLVLVASIYPAVRAARLKVLSAIHHV